MTEIKQGTWWEHKHTWEKDANGNRTRIRSDRPELFLCIVLEVKDGYALVATANQHDVIPVEGFLQDYKLVPEKWYPFYNMIYSRCVV